MNNPLISICIPSYNRADLIEETIHSALAQTYQNIEIIINDNCSTDGTWELLNEYLKKDSRIRIFRNEKNLGAVKNWQQVLSHAQGEYALILWSDDLIKAEFIEKTFNQFEESCAFVMTENEEFSDDNVYYTSSYGKDNKMGTTAYFYHVLFKNKPQFPVSPSCALFRTKDLKESVFNQIPNSDNIDFNLTGAGPDLLTYLVTASKYDYLKIINEPLALFRSHPQSITVMEKQKNGLKLHYDWAKYFFVVNYRKDLLKKFKAITWIRYFRYKKIHKNMLKEMKNVTTDFTFVLQLLLS